MHPSTLLATPRAALAGLGLLALSVHAGAQGFNVDFNGAAAILPAPTYAAAGTAGTWNDVQVLSTNLPLVDKSGAATGVTITTDTALQFSLTFDNANMAGDDAALLEDIIYGGVIGNFYPITFNGLANGEYDVYTYAIAPDAKVTFLTDVDVTQSTDGVQVVGGSLFTNGHTQGGSYAKHTATVTSGTLTVQVRINSGDLSVNGIQLEPNGGVGTPFCFGDGTGTTLCPCGNTGAAGRGCANSTASGGALLEATGSASVGAGDLVLVGSGAQPGQPGLYFQGNNAINGGNGIQNGDGLRCAGGSIRRLQVRTAGGAASANPGGSETTVNIAAVGAVNPGDTRRYQWWYRNPAPGGSSCGTTFNLSNGLQVVWTP